MRFTTSPSALAGRVRIPGSKSHTVRAVLLAALAEGDSTIREPLDSGDARSALAAAEGLGASVDAAGETWRITGIAGCPRAEGQTIDVGNSGTTLYMALAVAALSSEGAIRFDGDDQIRRRSAGNLLASLRDLGATVTVEGENDCCPITVSGPLMGGETTIECPTSQYLSALLMACPLARGTTRIAVPLLYEQPYVTMTLNWLRELGVQVNHTEDYSSFEIQGGQSVTAFDKAIPADFSSATFFLCAAATTGSELLLEGLDMNDPQGDKAVVEYLRAMGATITEEVDGLLVHTGEGLHGCELDLNATPDALPAMAVAAACADGTTVLGNVPQARMKETDRIAVMAHELGKLGVTIEEREDALVVHGGSINGGTVHGHGDHRVVMAFAIAGLAAKGPVTVDTAEAAAITFPNFAELLAGAGGAITRDT